MLRIHFLGPGKSCWLTCILLVSLLNQTLEQVSEKAMVCNYFKDHKTILRRWGVILVFFIRCFTYPYQLRLGLKCRQPRFVGSIQSLRVVQAPRWFLKAKILNLIKMSYSSSAVNIQDYAISKRAVWLMGLLLTTIFSWFLIGFFRWMKTDEEVPRSAI